jgi:hypothetical protein
MKTRFRKLKKDPNICNYAVEVKFDNDETWFRVNPHHGLTQGNAKFLKERIDREHRMEDIGRIIEHGEHIVYETFPYTKLYIGERSKPVTKVVFDDF